MILKLKDGEVKIKLFSDIAPNHVKRFKTLADSNQYDGVVFHRVIDGFMAQTGDVEFGNSTSNKYDLTMAGTGGSRGCFSSPRFFLSVPSSSMDDSPRKTRPAPEPGRVEIHPEPGNDDPAGGFSRRGEWV